MFAPGPGVTAPIPMLTLINGASCESVSRPLRLACKTDFLTSQFLSRDVDVRSSGGRVAVHRATKLATSQNKRPCRFCAVSGPLAH